ncbi:MAG TPA: serine/threonine-protein phosphatase, partial [Microbacterium sp.]|nr:serine/threonine-protein phosphatase [Microbacterium sp.]
PARQAANEPTHFEPALEFLEELIEEDRRRSRRRRLAWIAGFVIVLAMIGVALFGAYQWTQTRFFVGADDDTVVIYRGIQQNIGPISLSTPYEDTGILLADLSNFKRATVEGTISARSLADARAIVNALDPDDAEESDG